MTEKDLRRAYYPNYFSIDNILACQTLITCRTEMPLPKFGFLVPDCQSEDLPVGVNLQLPLWAARVLCKPGRRYVSVNIPNGFKEAHREVTEGKPTTTDLKKVNRQYFEAGHLCTSLFHNDAGELAEMLPEVLQQRILCIGETTIPYPRPSWVRKVYSNEPIPVELMDILERKIYEDADTSSKRALEWAKIIRNVPPSYSSHSAQQLIMKQHRLPETPPAQHSPQQPHHSPVNIPPVPHQPSLQHPIITSSHQNPYSNTGAPGHPSFMPQYVPMNMSLNQPAMTLPSTVPPTAHSLVNHTSGSNFHQSLPYQQQQAHLHQQQHLQQHHHHMM